MTEKTLKISLYQMNSLKGDVQSNLKKAEQAAKKSSLSGTQILMLPEFWTTGYDLQNLRKYSKDDLERIIAKTSEIAQKYTISIVGTTPQKVGHKIFNTAFFFNTRGEIKAQYNKLHLFRLMDEHKFLDPGENTTLFETDWGKCSLTICFDLRFPELYRKIADQGAKIVFIPAYWPAPRLEHWRILLRARAIENQIFIIGCNRCTLNHKLAFGYSAVIDPAGNILAEAGTEEILLQAEIETNKFNKIRNQMNLLESRRKDVY